LKEVLAEFRHAHRGRNIAVVISDLIGTRWYHYVLREQTATVIIAYLWLSGLRRVFVNNVPWYLSSSG
jgi:hypothetical protein